MGMKKAKLQELFKGITQSEVQVNKITETGYFWRVSFVNRDLGEMCITARKAPEIAQEIKRYAEVLGVQK